MSCVAVAAVAVIGVACGPPPAPPPPPEANPLTLGNGNAVGDGSAAGAVMSADGNVVAFTSDATNLVPGDSNGQRDLFVRDRLDGSVVRIASDVTSDVTISSNGRYVAYEPEAFTSAVYDRVSARTTEWTHTVSNARIPVVSPDGTRAVYGPTSSFGFLPRGCIVRDLGDGSERDCPPGSAGSGAAQIEAVSASARQVLYHWRDDDDPAASGRFVWNLESDTIAPVVTTVAVLGTSASISDDGRFITSVGFGSPLAPVLHDMQTATTTAFPVAVDASTVPIDISEDGSAVLVLSESDQVVVGDTNGVADVFLWEPQSGSVERISTTVPGGEQLPTGAQPCGPPPGQILADGSAGCVRALEQVTAVDTNAVVDAYLLP